MQQPRKPSPLEETMAPFIKMTQRNFETMSKNQVAMSNNHEASIENLEMQIGQLSSQFVSQTS